MQQTMAKNIEPKWGKEPNNVLKTKIQ